MKRNQLIRWIEEQRGVVLLDGGMGTLLAENGWNPPMLPEEMNLFRPDVLKDIHTAYQNAGARILETNTFGGSPLKMAHRGLDGRAREINAEAARLAKSAAGENVLVAGSVGPLGELLAPFGPLSFDDAYRSFRTQMEGLLEGGADFLLIETMIDLREAKAAVLAAKDLVPDGAFVVSFTFDQKGRTVTGTPPEVAARWAAFQGAAGVGANCGVGPEEYVQTVGILSEHAGIPVFVYANAGLPGNQEYRSPEVFASWGTRLAEAGADVIGGCCGTTPGHIAALAGAVREIPVKKHSPEKGTPLASRSRLVLAGACHPFRIIGERINVSRKSPLREEIGKFVWTTLREEARLQTDAGAHIIDVNVGLPSIDQSAAMSAAVTAVGQSTSLPVSIDSDSASVLESGLLTVTGIPLINSFTAKEDSLFPGLALAKRHGAVAAVLPLDESGLPESVEARINVIRRILSAADSLDFPREGLVVDGLTLAVGADSAAPAVTLAALSFLREEGITSVLGLSNVSHGMPARSLLNRTFLAMAVAAGLDCAIMNPLDRGMMETLAASEVLAGRDIGGKRFLSAAQSFFAHDTTVSSPRADAREKSAESESLAVAAEYLPLGLAVLHGDVQQAEEQAQTLLSSGSSPLDIVNQGVIPSLEEVGRQYDRGNCFLPQLISSAETAQRVCGIAMELFERSGGIASRGNVLLATVEGDLHDLGKNVVGTVLKSHGFNVVDLGKDVPSSVILEEAERGNFDFIGLSALMTSTMKNMASTTEEILRRLPGVFVIVGGASVDEEFARRIGAHGYAPDAVSSVRLVASRTPSSKRS